MVSQAISFTLISVIIVSLISFIGAVALLVKKKQLQAVLPLFIGFSAGALLGDSFIHLIPESVEQGFTLSISLYILFGILFAFVIEKIFHWRHYHHLEINKKGRIKFLGYMNLIGDGLHNFVDGVVIAASYLASIPLGLATTIAVIFHEVPQELGDFGVLLYAGFDVKKALLFNFLSAALAVIGGTLTLVFVSSQSWLPVLIPFTAGNFIYIASSNLIPELQKEVSFRKSLIQILTFILGIVVMISLLYVG